MKTKEAGRRFDIVEIGLVGVFCSLVGGLIGADLGRRLEVNPLMVELAPLAARYGPTRHSQFFEEWILRDFFGDRREGFFVDVGASDPITFSNTYFLEKELGWSGIAIDALSEFADGYRQHRPRTRFFAFFVSNRSDESVMLHVLSSNSLVSSQDRAFTQRWGEGAEEVEVPTITLNDLLSAQGVESFDLLSMDIELAEPKALEGLAISRFRPSLVCIEAHPEVRQAILDYFAANNYVLVGRYLRADLSNLYFSPRT